MSDILNNTLQGIYTLFAQPLIEVWHGFLTIVPSIVMALVFLVIGLVLARLLSAVTVKLLRRIHLDDITSHVGVNEIFARAGFGKSPSVVVSFVIYWSVMIVFIMMAGDVLHLSAVSDLLQRFTLFIPRLIMAIVILFAGMLIAPLAYRVVNNSTSVNNIKGGATLAKVIEAVVLIFSVLIALEQLGVEMKIIISTVQILLGSVGLAFAIAFGLGAKDLAGEFLKGFFSEPDKK
jgi:small-conductance mechanosensitive channel